MSSELVDIRSIVHSRLRSPKDLAALLAPSRSDLRNGTQTPDARTERDQKAARHRPISIQAADRLSSAAEAISAKGAKDAGALGFMARTLVQTTLPHREQTGNQYTRNDGHLRVSITALNGAGLPYGSYPRLILMWMTTEAIRSGKRELVLGKSLSSFMAQLGLQSTGGQWGTIPRFRDQMVRLLGAAITTRWYGEEAGIGRDSGGNLLLADSFELWWTPQHFSFGRAPTSSIVLSQGFFDQIVEAPIPLDLRAIRALKRSPLALDLYAWSTRRVSYLNRSILVPWAALRVSFGAGYAETPQGKSRFRANAIDALRRVSTVYPQLNWAAQEAGLTLRPSAAHIPKLMS